MQKRIVIYLYILLAPISICCGQTKNAHKSQGAIIEFASYLHDYDTITQGKEVTAQFQFFNKGDAPLLISSVSSSCGCTTPLWNKKPVMPGEDGFITVRYKASNTGTFRKTIVVSTNANNSPKTVLRIQGVVDQKECR